MNGVLIWYSLFCVWVCAWSRCRLPRHISATTTNVPSAKVSIHYLVVFYVYMKWLYVLFHIKKLVSITPSQQQTESKYCVKSSSINNYLLTNNFKTLRFITNKKKTHGPCNRFKRSVGYEYSGDTSIIVEITSVLQVMPIIRNNRKNTPYLSWK